MTISELLEQLEDAVEAGWGDAEVRLAYQPQFHPFAIAVSDASTLVEGVFYICEGERLGALPGHVEDVLINECDWGAERGL